MSYISPSPVTVVLSADNKYLPYLAVTIQSLCAHASTQNHYEIYILHENITEENACKILTMQQEHISITFLSITEYLKTVDTSAFYLPSYPTLATYYRIFIPELFPDKEKVLYLDCDVVLCTDIANIFQYEMGTACIAAVHDYGVRIRYKQKPRIHSYIDNILAIDVQQYFQAGVILFAVQNMRSQNFLHNCLTFMAANPSPVFADQDVLNKVCESAVLFLPWEYNVLWHIPLLEKEALLHFKGDDAERYAKAATHPAIIHYSSSCKPWHFPNLPLADVFWQVAKLTSFLPEIQAEKAATQKKLHLEMRLYPGIFALSCFWKGLSLLPFKPLREFAFRKHTQYRLKVIEAKRAKRLQTSPPVMPTICASTERSQPGKEAKQP